MKVLVTGATGFIGGRVAHALVGHGYEVRAMVRDGSSRLALDGTGAQTVLGDVRDRESVTAALNECQGLVHCAARYSFWNPRPDATYDVNVNGTRIILEEALRAGLTSCVYTSTVSTVGQGKEPATEEAVPTDKHLVGHYKRSKFLAEREALGMAAKGLPVVVVNPTAPVGPGDVKPTPTGKMVLDFIRGRVPAYINTGMNLVDVDDVAIGHVLALEKGKPGERYLLGNRNMTLGQMFRLLEEVSGKKAPWLRLPLWLVIGAAYLDLLVEGKVLRKEPQMPLEGLKVSRKPMYVSCQKAVRELDLPQSPIEGALERAVRWFEEHGYTGSTTAKEAIPAVSENHG